VTTPPDPTASAGSAGSAARGPYVSLFWRLFIPNAAVLTAAMVILMVEPANGRVVALAGGLAAMVTTNLLLIRRAVAPLERLTRLMRRIDPLEPGRRVPVDGPESEVRVLARAFNEMLDRLETERRESARRALTVQEAERRHLASELHDEIGQTLTGLVLQLDRSLDRPEGDRSDLRRARETAEAALDEVRQVARRIRPEALDDLGLVPALTSLCERFAEHSGLRVVSRLERELPSLSPESDVVIYRVAQESLTNAARHADAQTVRVSLRAEGSDVELSVADDGRGLPAARLPEDGGIRGMRERAVLAGAELSLQGTHGAGTVVRLRVRGEDGK
jgi:two-component system, NarL family, sensor histidine kinase UhpB